jgi:hypothetical protein
MSNLNFARKTALLGYVATFVLVACTFSAEAADKGLTAILDKPVAEVQKAAVTALTVIGCEIKTEEPLVVEGVRKRKFGVVVGSGGETVRASLSEKEPGKTEVTVTTKKSFVGMAGQKNWNQSTLDEINKALTEGPATPAVEAVPSPPEPTPSAVPAAEAVPAPAGAP